MLIIFLILAMLSREEIAARILQLPVDKQPAAAAAALALYGPAGDAPTQSTPPTFRGAALDLQSATDREIIVHGPWETGKTFAALWRIDSLLRETPKARGLMLRKVRADMDASCIQTYKKIIEMRGGVKTYGGEAPRWFDYSESGARLWIVGLDNPGKALSAEFDFIYGNQIEELELADWETLTGRCTGRAGNTDKPQIIGDCNPGSEDHWILKRAASGALRLLKSLHRDNPRLYTDAGELTEAGALSMRTLMALTGIRKSRGYEGEWVGAEGLFFEEWDDDLHTCAPFPIPADWPVWGALDIGRAHNTAWGCLTENDGVIYLVAEHVKNNWPIAQHCKAIRRQLEIRGVHPSRINQTVAGHDAFTKRVGSDGRDGQEPAELYKAAVDQETGEAIGISLEKATLDRIAGATRLAELLGNRELKISPRLKIFNTCKRTIATMTRMVKNPRDPEDVLKVDADINGDGGDDPYDMLRYGVMVKNDNSLAGLFWAGEGAEGWTA
jgi:hypothetical protein